MITFYEGFHQQLPLDASELIAVYLHLPLLGAYISKRKNMFCLTVIIDTRRLLCLTGAYTLACFGTVFITYHRKLKGGIPLLTIISMYFLCFVNTGECILGAIRREVARVLSARDGQQPTLYSALIRRTLRTLARRAISF